tara:strand:+ start:412 stop:1065 length:654 start_codon:yes stop_codon:yes gene_type:complete
MATTRQERVLDLYKGTKTPVKTGSLVNRVRAESNLAISKAFDKINTISEVGDLFGAIGESASKLAPLEDRVRLARKGGFDGGIFDILRGSEESLEAASIGKAIEDSPEYGERFYFDKESNQIVEAPEGTRKELIKKAKRDETIYEEFIEQIKKDQDELSKNEMFEFSPYDIPTYKDVSTTGFTEKEIKNMGLPRAGIGDVFGSMMDLFRNKDDERDY